MLDQARETLGTYYTSIESGPGDWTDRYLQSIVKTMPAVRVAFHAAEAVNSTALSVDSRWSVYILNGWSKDQAARRRDTGSAIGVYRAASLLAPRLHQHMIDLDEEETTVVRVTEIANLWNGELDIWQLTLLAIEVTVRLPLNINQDIDGFDDFLRVGVDWDIRDEGDDAVVDLPGQFEIPQG